MTLGSEESRRKRETSDRRHNQKRQGRKNCSLSAPREREGDRQRGREGGRERERERERERGGREGERERDDLGEMNT